MFSQCSPSSPLQVGKTNLGWWPVRLEFSSTHFWRCPIAIIRHERGTWGRFRSSTTCPWAWPWSRLLLNSWNRGSCDRWWGWQYACLRQDCIIFHILKYRSNLQKYFKISCEEFIEYTHPIVGWINGPATGDTWIEWLSFLRGMTRWFQFRRTGAVFAVKIYKIFGALVWCGDNRWRRRLEVQWSNLWIRIWYLC